MNEWKPIETAPKDGTQFLTTDGRFYEVLNQPPGCERGVWAETWPGSGVWSGSCVRHIDPTHWTPLPPLRLERTADQVRACTRAALERAAQICDEINSESGGGWETFGEAIRAEIERV